MFYADQSILTVLIRLLIQGKKRDLTLRVADPVCGVWQMYGQASAIFLNKSGLSITRVASVITEIVLRLLMLLLISCN